MQQWPGLICANSKPKRSLIPNISLLHSRYIFLAERTHHTNKSANYLSAFSRCQRLHTTISEHHRRHQRHRFSHSRSHRNQPHAHLARYMACMSTIYVCKAIGDRGDERPSGCFRPIQALPPNVGLESIRHVFFFVLVWFFFSCCLLRVSALELFLGFFYLC